MRTMLPEQVHSSSEPPRVALGALEVASVEVVVAIESESEFEILETAGAAEVVEAVEAVGPVEIVLAPPSSPTAPRSQLLAPT